MPERIDARLSGFRAQTRKSHHAILLDAIESTYDELPGLIRTALGRDGEEEQRVNLFGRAPRTTALIPAETGPKIRHTVRVTKSSRDLLDDLTARFEAPSRNFLVVTAYDAYLPQTT